MKVQQLTTLFATRRRRPSAPPVRPRLRAVRLLMLGALVVVLAGVWAVASLVLYVVTPYGALYPQSLISRLSANYQPWDAASQPLLAPLNPNVAQANDRDSQPSQGGTIDGSDVLPAAVLPEAPRPVNVYGGSGVAALSPTLTSTPTPTPTPVVVVAAATGTATPTNTPTATSQIIGAATTAPSSAPSLQSPQSPSTTLPTAEAPKVPGTTPPAATSTDAPSSTPAPTSTPVTVTPVTVTPVTVTPVTVTPVTVTPVTPTPVTPTPVTPTPVTPTPVTPTPVTPTPVTPTPVTPTPTPVTPTPVTPTPTPTVQFSAATYSVGEARSSATITVTLSVAAAQVVTVSYATSDDTAKAGSDYTATSGTLSFGAGETVKTFAVPIMNDAVAEPNETLKLTLSSPTNAALGTQSSAILTVSDDDKPTVQFRTPFTSFANDRVPESAATVTLTVQLSLAQSQPVTVDYAVSGTATSGSDYTLPNGTLTFAAGETSKVLTIQIVPDIVDEADETISVTLLNPSANALLGGNAVATLTIVDDDLATVQFSQSNYIIGEGGNAEITVSLNTPATQAVTINYATSNATAVAGSDYTATNGTLTFAPGVTSQTFNVQTNGDALNEGTETLSLTLTNPTNATLGTPSTATLTLTDGPTVQFENAAYSVLESSGQATVNVTLSSPSALPITVSYATSDATAVQPGDYTAKSGTLTFAPGVTSQSFTVPIANDTLNETNETVALTLSNPTNAWVGTPNSAVLTITDDDTPPTVQFGSTSYSVTESGGAAGVKAVINVTLSAPSGQTVTVNYATSDGTATQPGDYTAASGTLTFAPSETSKTFNVLITDDALDETDETVNLKLNTLANANATLGTPSTAVLTIADDDVQPTVSFGADVSVPEAAGTTALVATLSAVSGQNVTVPFTVNGTAIGGGVDHTLMNGSIFIPVGSPSGSIPFNIINDSLNETNETIVITIGLPVNAGVGSATQTITVTDDDPRPQVSFDADYAVSESAGSASITAILNTVSGRSVIVPFTVSGTSTAIGGGVDHTLADGTITIPAGSLSASATFNITDDNLDEPDETIIATMGTPTRATLGGKTTQTITLLDNDGPTVQFSSTTYSVNEGDGTATITVSLSNASTQMITVNYATSDGTATAGSDYTATSGTLTFTAGVITQTLTVMITDDNLSIPLGERDETIKLTLSGVTNATLGTPNPATLTIFDDEPRVTFANTPYTVVEGDSGVMMATITVVLTKNPSAPFAPFTVQYNTSDGTATAGSDYSATTGTLIFSGVGTQTFTVPVNGDILGEQNETVHLKLQGIGIVPDDVWVDDIVTDLTIMDDEPHVQFSSSSYSVNELAGTAMITVSLSKAAGSPVSVDYKSVDGTAVAGSDYSMTNGTLTFATGETVKTFTVSIINNILSGPDTYLTLELLNVVNSNAALGGPNVATLTINDNKPRVQFSMATYTVNEGGGSATIQVALDHPSSSTITVQYATSDGTALEPGDYMKRAGTVTFAPGQTVQTFNVPIVDDALTEGDETVQLTLSTPANNADLGGPINATLTIVDND